MKAHFMYGGYTHISLGQQPLCGIRSDGLKGKSADMVEEHSIVLSLAYSSTRQGYRVAQNFGRISLDLRRAEGIFGVCAIVCVLDVMPLG